MRIDDDVIMTLIPTELMDKEVFYSLMEIRESEERARLEALAEIRAKELGIEQQFKRAMKAYKKASDELAKEYTRNNAKRTFPIKLETDSYGKPLNTINNFLEVLTRDSRFAGLKFNELTYSPEKEVEGKRVRWTDADDAETRWYIEHKYKFHSAANCDDALRIVFASNKYHPIRDIIDGLQWDGENRIEHFLHRWTRCEDTPYSREVSRLIFAGGIHRLYNPGCKFDDMPVLIGTRQGEGKSTLVRWLAMSDDYFTEVNEFDGQRGIEALEGAWICEVGELLALTKTKEQEAVKAFLTRQNDRYRMPFDKRVTDHPRQCIFLGTTNKEFFLSDKTGNRRFYPIKVNQTGYDIFDKQDEVKEYIRQCWAEAKVRFDADEIPPYLDRRLVDDARFEQANAVEEDFREGMIRAFLEGKKKTCVIDIWEHALHNDFKPTRKDSNDIVLILQGIDGWERDKNGSTFPPYGYQACWSRQS